MVIKAKILYNIFIEKSYFGVLFIETVSDKKFSCEVRGKFDE